MIFGILYNDIILYVLVFARIASALSILPILGSQSYPAQVKIGLSLLFSFLLMPTLKTTNVAEASSVLFLLMDISKEIVVGLLLGFLASMLFAGIELAGQLIAIQMGFGMVNVLDPQSFQQVSLISQVKVLIASMLFIAIDGHHFLLEGLYQSFTAVPLLGAKFPREIFEINMHVGAMIFISAVKIGAPVIVTLLLTSVSLGLVARAVPQMNVFFVGMPLKIGLGMAAMSFSLSFFAYAFRTFFDQFKVEYMSLIRLLGH
jgi:flagellar biosynthetic protein FliR